MSPGGPAIDPLLPAGVLIGASADRFVHAVGAPLLAERGDEMGFGGPPLTTEAALAAGRRAEE